MNSRRFIVAKIQAGSTLQDFLSGQLNVSRNRAKALIDDRQVFVNTKRVWMARHSLKQGDTIEVMGVERRVAPSDQSAVLYQDDHYLIVNKPSGRLANGPDSVEQDLRAATGLAGLQAVHRLDRDTTGCLLLAKDQEGFDRAVEMFQDRRVLKLYHAIAAGRVSPAVRIIETPIEGQSAATNLQILDSNNLATHLKLKLETGRTHQIRKHLESIRHPILGDKSYGTWHTLPNELRLVERQMLHAACLQFESPFTGSVIRIESPLPRDFRDCLRRLRLT